MSLLIEERRRMPLRSLASLGFWLLARGVAEFLGMGPVGPKNLKLWSSTLGIVRATGVDEAMLRQPSFYDCREPLVSVYNLSRLLSGSRVSRIYEGRKRRRYAKARSI
jgi:hypothetical protein